MVHCRSCANPSKYIKVTAPALPRYTDLRSVSRIELAVLGRCHQSSYSKRVACGAELCNPSVVVDSHTCNTLSICIVMPGSVNATAAHTC